MTTTIEVNVFGYDPKWKDGTNHKYYTGKFVYQQVSPQGQQLMDTKGNLNLANLDISDEIVIFYNWMSPWVASEGTLYFAQYWDDADDNFWIVKGSGKPKQSDNAGGTGQFVVELESPTRLKVTDKNDDKAHYNYSIAVRLFIAEQSAPDISDGEFFVDDPKITNRGNDRVIRLAQYQSAD
ncbi:hypothetical protein KUW15_02280 [Qipengyuania aquimaris]|uniref:hypothetical protein n=1 Tax=Qipengyuania aquimaris TaxID=255984 RepID=UPI001C9671A1|nr:hypothetical protein [Qipengyuania aquimaris]MBY6127535.1 hypothetical protein [Qipengyuania aquimaris]